MSQEILYVLGGGKEHYDKYQHLITKGMSKGDHLSQIIADLDKYYTAHPGKIDWEQFGTWFNVVAHPALKDDSRDVYNTVFDQMNYLTEEDLPLMKEIVSSFVIRDYGERVADLALRAADTGENVVQQILELTEQYSTDLAADDDDYFVGTTLEDIVKDKLENTGYSWPLASLNKSIGPIHKGHLILIGSRPDAGKTTFLCHSATHMASQMGDDEVILWFNNEEAGEKVKYRIIQSSVGWTDVDMHSLPTDAYEQSSWDKFMLYDRADIHMSEVKRLCMEYKPSLVVFDQLHKVYGHEMEKRDDIRLQRLAADAREIAKKYCAVLVVHQANGAAEGQKWIGQDQFAGNTTTLPGEADAIIMIGREDDTNNRYINIPKNKLGGSVPELRNGKFNVTIKGETARFEDAYG